MRLCFTILCCIGGAIALQASDEDRFQKGILKRQDPQMWDRFRRQSIAYEVYQNMTWNDVEEARLNESAASFVDREGVRNGVYGDPRLRECRAQLMAAELTGDMKYPLQTLQSMYPKSQCEHVAHTSDLGWMWNPKHAELVDVRKKAQHKLDAYYKLLKDQCVLERLARTPAAFVPALSPYAVSYVLDDNARRAFNELYRTPIDIDTEMPVTVSHAHTGHAE